MKLVFTRFELGYYIGTLAAVFTIAVLEERLSWVTVIVCALGQFTVALFGKKISQKWFLE